MLPLVPYPVEVRRGHGRLRLAPGTPVYLSAGLAGSLAVRRKLETLGLRRRSAPSLPENTVIVGEARLRVPRPPARPEGYALRVTPDGCALAATDADGAFWGLVTLEQLLAGGRECPCVRIRDYPAFPFRMHHDDVSRKQISRLDDFKRIVRLLSGFKVRYYTLYLEDMLCLRHFPDIGRGRGRLTATEARGLLAAAAAHNVTVFPTFSLAGHQENLFRNPRYRRYAREVFQEPSSYDVGKPGLRPFLRKVIADVCELFPDAPIFHAGFDEVIGLERDEFLAHANWCAREIARHGRKMMMWVDMLKNHWGLELLRELDGNILPVEWNYADPREQEDAYRRVGVIPYGLAGYNNGHALLPDFRRGRANIERWAALMGRWGGPGFGASQWGDDGYENSRDLCWQLFACNGEAAWRGRVAPRLEERFQAVFYGRPLPSLTALHRRYAAARSLDPGRLWTIFRWSLPQMVRALATQPELRALAARDLRRVEVALRLLVRARREARQEREHLDHYECALLRERDACERVLLAARVREGLAGARLARAVRRARRRLRKAREFYERTWLARNKRPNIEVSLAVFDRVDRSLAGLMAGAAGIPAGFQPLELGSLCNVCMPEVGDLPLRASVVNGVPFRFAPWDKTHLDLPRGEKVKLALEPRRVRDLHLVLAGRTIDRERKRGRFVLDVSLLRGRRIVFRERLEAIYHVCDWWAPLGEHIWAGGGFKYVDPGRVAYAFSPGYLYGLTHLRGFETNGVEADTLVLRRLGAENVYVFALSIEGDKIAAADG